MALCGAVSAGLAALLLAAQRVDTRQLICGVALLALSPLLLGAVLLSRYDLFPTMSLSPRWPRSTSTASGPRSRYWRSAPPPRPIPW